MGLPSPAGRRPGWTAAARRAVDLYLSAAWRLWRQLPVVARSSRAEEVRAAAEAVLRVLDDAVGVLVDGHQVERREMVRREEAVRAEFVDDLLRGDANASRPDQRFALQTAVLGARLLEWPTRPLPADP